MNNLSTETKNHKENCERGRIVKTKNVDLFLNCDNANMAELEGQIVEEEQDDEEEPEWDDVDTDQLKSDNVNMN